MFDFILSIFTNIWQSILSMFGFSFTKGLPKQNSLQVFVRTNIGEQVCVSLDPSWTIGKVKADLSNLLKTPEKDLRIIFAGKELPDDLLIQQCDLGNKSMLHAVRVVTPQENPDLPLSYESTSQVLQSEQQSGAREENEEFVQNISKFESSSHKKATLPTLLCDPSTVMTIQLSERELNQIKQLKAEPGEELRPHFYVYCIQPCASVRIGKLRVRCSHCKEGALTLHKDPNSWLDVLQSHQVTSTCASPGCGETYAEFFFKCREHETTGIDDMAVPLYLLRSNLPGVPCLACMDPSSPIVVFQCTNAHVMCLDCFITYCISRLNERQFIRDEKFGYTLACPMGCENSLIEEIHHFKLMGDQQYERYQRFGTEEAVLAAGGILCPQPGCGQGIIPDEDCRRITCIGGCGYVFCKDCLQGYHIGECHNDEQSHDSSLCRSLSFDPQRAAKSRWEDPSNLAIRVLTKPCPKCRTPTERDGGCMHMICTRASCQFNWCWVCQTEWTRECMAAHWFG